MSWYWLDIAIVSIIVLSIITGLFRGLVKEVIALCVWVAGFWVAFHYGALLDPWISHYIHDQSMKAVVEFLLILFGVLILGGITNSLISMMMHRSGLKGTDRLLGMGFGFARGVFIIAFIIVGAKMTGIPCDEYGKSSKLYGHFDPIVAWLNGFVPTVLDKVKVIDGHEAKSIDIARDL